ncbi:MAG: GNAT family N-acetyltransferase [Gammaproteobacteria bacterium]|nr:GNAT family N-acetyltransferase [Gammaproteobacteria bacterium]
MMTMIEPELIQLKSNEYAIIHSLATYYEYDMSRYCGHLPGWEFPIDGTYTSKALLKNLKAYFTEKDKYPFLIRIDEHPAGFVMVNKKGTTPDVDWNMGEFFVVATYQRRKVGQRMAREAFDRFQGRWEVAVIPQNTGALKFWEPLIANYSHGVYTRELKTLMFPEQHQMIVFGFQTPTYKEK